MNTWIRSSGLGLCVVAVVLLSLLFSVSLFGQAVSATLLGSVSDVSGASVANAKVTLTESNTNVSRTAQTNESGNFVFPDLPPGTYTVAVEMTGFKKETRTDIAVLVNTTQRVDVKLQPGNITETVEVTGAPPALQTDRADTGRNIDTMVVSELPVLVSNRNYQALLALVPGTAPPTEEHSQFFNASDSLQTEVNGAPRVANNYQIEGIDDNERTGLLQILIPPLEAIQTVDVSTSDHTVDLGRGAGAVTNVILKSGSNQFHGSLYEFLQNGDFDARNFFQPSVAAVHYNYFGGTIGGPIKKNKLFFFADFLRTSDHEANANTETIPSQLSRTGNLSEALAGSSPALVYDPLTGNTTTGVGRTPFPGNIIPTSRLNPIALKILALVPLPNEAYSTLAPSNNYFALLPFTKDNDFTDGKVDYTISEKDRISVRFSFQRPVVYQAPIFGPAGGDANGAFEGTGLQDTYSTGANWDHVFSPTLLNEFRFGVAYYHNSAQESDYGLNASTSLGIPGINVSQFDSGLVGINIGAFTEPLVGYSASLPWIRAEANIDLVDNVTKTHGNHTFTIGFDMRRIRDDLLQTQTYSPRGVYTFGTAQTQCAGSCLLANGTTSSATTPNNTTSWANDMASFLLDSPGAGGTGRDFSGTFPTYRAWYFFPYAADRWQVNHKLTVDIGLRWEFYPPGLPAFPGQFSNYIPSNNTLVVGGVGGNPNNGGLADHLNYLAPRLGVAYRLTEKTVLRAGGGVSYTPFEDNTYINNNYPTKGNIGAVQGASAYTSASYNGSLLNFESGLPVPAPQPIPSNGIYSVAALGFNGSTEGFFPTNFKNPHIIAWNVSLQQSLPAHFTMDVAYVGNHGVDMGSSQNINGSQVIAPTSAGDPAYLPYFPHTGAIDQYFVPVSSMYNALQVKIDRRFASGLSITSSLSYQKGMAYYNGGDDDGFYGFYLNGQYHRNWGLNDFNRTVTFVQSYVYQLPFGKGKHLLGSASRGLDMIVGGWQIEGILTVMTGTPFTVTYSSTYLNLDQGGTNTPIEVDPSVQILHGINTTSNGGAPWFNPAAFAAPPCQSATPSPSCPTGAIDQIGGAAQQVGNVGRNSMIGPGFFNLNAALSKTMHFSERVALQLRLETINTTNTPQFANPNGSCCTANNANFGFVTGTVGSGSGSVNAGTGGPRSLQLAAKLTF
jgi:hypothetical protein